MHYRDVLKTCATTLSDRGKKYGDSDVCFTRIAKIASLVLDKPISTYDIAIILACVKLGRIPGNPTYDDNYVDLANYAAFAAHFAGSEPQQTVGLNQPSVNLSDFTKPVEDNVRQHPGYVRIRRPVVDEAAFAAAIDTVEEDVIDTKRAKKE